MYEKKVCFIYNFIDIFVKFYYFYINIIVFGSLCVQKYRSGFHYIYFYFRLLITSHTYFLFFKKGIFQVKGLFYQYHIKFSTMIFGICVYFVNAFFSYGLSIVTIYRFFTFCIYAFFRTFYTKLIRVGELLFQSHQKFLYHLGGCQNILCINLEMLLLRYEIYISFLYHLSLFSCSFLLE